MRREKARLDAAGLAVVLIGMGEPDEAQAFRAQLRLPFVVLCDPDRAAYRQFQLDHLHLEREAHLREIGKLVAATVAHGGALSKHQDTQQLGGVFLVGQDGRIRYAHHARTISDHPPLDDVLAAART